MRTSAAAEDAAQQSIAAIDSSAHGSTPPQPAARPPDEAVRLQHATSNNGSTSSRVESSEGHVSSSGTGAAGRHPLQRRGLQSRLQPTSELWQQARAFREMLRKRALTASRDVRGAVFTLLLPILAVAAVLVSCLHGRS